MEYLIKASAVVAIFYVCYKLFLQRDTFFESNRGFLLMGLISAFLVPLVVIPVYVEQGPLFADNLVFNTVVSNVPTSDESLSLTDIILYAYLAGVLLFLVKFLIELGSLCLLLIQHKSTRHGKYKYVKIEHNTAPFSFFNWIVYNPELFNKQELKLILTHEKVHARQLHSIDILLTQLACIALWFNPLIWLYNKDLKQNLEFIADHNAQRHSQCKKSYQYTLLKTSMPTHQLALTNNFYNSLIKKRIVMLHKSKSKKTNLFKYALVLPLLAIFLMSFNTKEVYVTPKINPEVDSILYPDDTYTEALLKDIEIYVFGKDFTDADFEKLTEKLKKNGITAKFKGINHNSKGEITAIKIDLKTKQSNANYSISSDDPIKPIKITIEDNGANISIGNAEHHADAMFTSEDGNHILHNTEKNKKIIVLSDDDDSHEIEKEIHIIHGDSINRTSSEEEGKRIIIKKQKNVEVISDDDAEEHIEVIIEGDNDTKDIEEDIIIMKKKGDDKTSFKVKTITSDNEKSKFIVMSDDEATPLFIIDGKESEKDPIKELNPDDIEKINVLKGDEAKKLYGDKGKNGVIEITTKKK